VAAGKEDCDADTASGKTTDDKYCHRAWPQRFEQLINRPLIIESFDDIKASRHQPLPRHFHPLFKCSPSSSLIAHRQFNNRMFNPDPQTWSDMV
jgi:hypothetical protein